MLHATKQLNLPYDTYWLTLLLALDANTAFRWWIWWRSRR